VDGFWSKLDNLAYELFGVVLPGLVASVWLAMLWYALGPLVPLWSFGYLPSLTDASIKYLLKVVPGALEVTAIIGTLLVWYFLGHVLNWVSKGFCTRVSREGTWARLVLLEIQSQKTSRIFRSRLN